MNIECPAKLCTFVVFSRMFQAVAFALALATWCFFQNSCLAQKDLLGPVGPAKDLYGPAPKGQQDSPECQRAKAILAARGKPVPKDCAMAIKLAGDLGAQEYLEQIKALNDRRDELLKNAAAEQARTRAENEQRRRDGLRKMNEQIRGAKRDAKQQQRDAAVQGLQGLVNSGALLPAPLAPVSEYSDKKGETTPSQSSESEVGLQKILDAPTPVDVLSKLNFLSRLEKIAKEAANRIWDPEIDTTRTVPTPESVRLAKKSAKDVASPIGQKGAEVVFQVGDRIDQIFENGEKSYGRKLDEAAKDMFR